MMTQVVVVAVIVLMVPMSADLAFPITVRFDCSVLLRGAERPALPRSDAITWLLIPSQPSLIPTAGVDRLRKRK